MRRAKDPWLWAGWLAALPVLALPVGDPDLWWHLSAARWMTEHLAWPRADWLSYTMAGAPWVDFEWLAELVFYGVYSWAGLPGLWAVKAALLVAAGAVVERTLRELGVAAPYRAAGLAWWAVTLLPRDDIRTEQFSVLFFVILLRSVLLGRLKPAAVFLGFALWSNLHAGFAYGLLFLGLAAAGDARRRRELGLACLAGAAGALVNPYGLSVYAVLWRHLREVGGLRRYIMEWGGLTLARPGHWPAVLLIMAAAWAVLGTGPWRSKLALLVFGAMTVRHARSLAYFASCIPLAAALVPLEEPSRRVRRAAAAALAACAAFSIWRGLPLRVFRAFSHDFYSPGTAEAFLARHGQLAGGRLYHPWGWGGALGWRLFPEYRVFQDGRYLFHPLLIEAAAAARSPSSWEGFLDRHGISVAVLENIPLRLPTTRRYPDKTERVFSRPYYLAYMPRERWALVHFDDRGLVFVKRDALAGFGLDGQEYRLLRPSDEEALQDALRRGEADARALEAEKARHERELRELGAG